MDWEKLLKAIVLTLAIAVVLLGVFSFLSWLTDNHPYATLILLGVIGFSTAVFLFYKALD